jgi:hypothetical protein
MDINTTLDSLEDRKEAFCERIICLHRPGEYPGWWHALENDDRMLFAPRGRILEASMDAVAMEAKRAVQEGLRPLFFVPRLSDWPEVYEAMDHYQDFGAVYIHGRHDPAMSELLYEPSPDVLEVYAGEGRILVPNVAYGKALDRLLDADLTDFLRDEAADRSDW